MLPGGGGALRRVALLLLRVAVAAAFVAANLAIATVRDAGLGRRRGSRRSCLRVVAIWLFFSDRLALTLGVVVLYLGLIDGYVKLRTGLPIVTFGRDILLYAIVLGLLVRSAVRREPLPVPPLCRTRRRVRRLHARPVAESRDRRHRQGHGGAPPAPRVRAAVPAGVHDGHVAAPARGASSCCSRSRAPPTVSSAWSSSTSRPQELALWGPGYEQRIFGTGDVSGRTFHGRQRRVACATVRTDRPTAAAAD